MGTENLVEIQPAGTEKMVENQPNSPSPLVCVCQILSNNVDEKMLTYQEKQFNILNII